MPKKFIFLSSFIFLTIQAFCLDDFIFNGFKQPNTNLSLSGTAKVDKHGILQLTNNTGRLMGHALFPAPIQFKNSDSGPVMSFSTCFAFNIVPEYPRLGGHGLAFTVSPSQDFIKSALPSQYLGLLNATEVVEQDLNLKSGKTIVAWIEYDSIKNLVNVTLSPSFSKPRLPIISYHLDLTPIFQKTMYIGFSASTGLLASSHYVLGWSFKVNGDAKSLNFKSLPSLPGHKKRSPVLIIIVSVLSVMVLVGLVFLAIHAVKKYKNRDIIEDWELEVGPHRFSYKELKKATKGFKESELLGVGGFGKVYKGTLSSKLEVAVKRISNESKQGLREFVSEISTIGKLRHRNLVQLQGWCRLRGDLLLVYDYMPNASLDRFLFEKPISVLSWEQRFNIIKGVASGLFYLHEGYEQIVIHRDIKASNVLLDADLNGRVGDFGMAKLYEHGENPTTTRVVGTLGYLAPELPRTGRATTSSDVFAFGALLLEVVCGRRPIENRAPPEEFVLVDWVWDKWIQGRPFDVVDKKLEGEFDENEVVVVLKLGLMCSNYVANSRPNMRQVVRYLEGEVRLPGMVRPPGGCYDDGKGGGEGFDDYINSFASSSFDKGSLYSDGAQPDADLSFVSVSASPMSLLYKKGEAR
ncbi:Non-specific serine/threonine protein kinase [Heracleum sosnowskyi]|uniref:non-specific serine/threonine protein kinase n=1 Tax=Heracleum sosnowskyi TaxID=360622 RepID=A0AAD8GUE5_9APIA|nr:Non-specific serine/threonine protein kinase [Heracleum sosnowskyi]